MLWQTGKWGDRMDAEQLLRNLGATGKLKGFFFAIYMIEKVKNEPAATTLITKCLYPEAAKHFSVSAGAIERNLRTLIRTCWNRPNRDFMEEVAGASLYQQPTNGEFLDMTAAYLRRQDTPQT